MALDRLRNAEVFQGGVSVPLFNPIILQDINVDIIEVDQTPIIQNPNIQIPLVDQSTLIQSPTISIPLVNNAQIAVSPVTITIPRGTVDQGKDTFNTGDLFYVLGNVAAQFNPEIIHGSADISYYAPGEQSPYNSSNPYSLFGGHLDDPKFDTNLNSFPTITNQADKNEAGGLANYAALTYDQIGNLSSRTVLGGQIEDFRADLNREPGTVKNDNYKVNHLVRRIQIGDYGNPSADRTDWKGNTGLEDKINTSVYDESFKDLVKLKFKDLRKQGTTPQRIVQFRSLINSFSDIDDIVYEDVRYIGRPDIIKNFTGISRVATIGFVVMAGTRNELKVIYEKLNVLRAMVLPEFRPGRPYMIGPLLEFTLGDYFKDAPATIISLRREIKPEYTWEINMQPDTLFEAPKLIDVNVDLFIYGNETPSVTNKSFGML